MAEQKRLRELVLRGSHRDIGRQFGEACRDSIPAFIDVILGRDVASRGLPQHALLSRETALARTHLFLPLFTRYAPLIVEEVRGIMEGARISFEEALLLQIRGEIAFVPEGGCTAFAVQSQMTASGDVLIGQNSDMGFAAEMGLVVQILADDAPPSMMWTFPGLLGYHGINALGVAHFANQLAGPAWRMGLPHYPLKRAMLGQSSLEDVVQVIERYPICSSGNYVLADGQGKILDVEVTPEGYAALQPRHGYLAHTNHFLSERFAPTERYLAEIPDSVTRLARIEAALEARQGNLRVEDVKAILSTHDGGGCGICRHGATALTTIGSIIAEPGQGRMHIAAGTPCVAAYETYTLVA